MKENTIPIILFLLVSFLCQAQESKIDQTSVSRNYESEHIDASKVLSRAEQWFTSEENSEQYEVVSLDKESGELKVEGTTKVLYKNLGKELYPKRNGMAEVLEASFGNRVKIKTNEGGYTITYDVIDMKQEMYKMEDLFFNCINFQSIDEQPLSEYNKAMNKLLKANLVFKKRREVFTNNSKSQFEEVSSYLLNAGELTVFSLHEAIMSDVD